MDWSLFDKLTDLARFDLLRVCNERQVLLNRWNALLADLGGDPSARDWSRFRPLRLSREEDWSDWLAYLIETSRGGRLACLLLGDAFGEDAELGACTVSREERTKDGERRGDLIVEWESGAHAHVEVKIGDKGFRKVFEAGRKLHERHPAATVWKNFMLLPAEDLDEWKDVKKHEIDEEDEGLHDTVEELTWDDVAVALRKALAAKEEDVIWRAWAYAFTGAVEQRLLGHLATTRNTSEVPTKQLRHLNRLARQTELLKKGLENVE
ncbi:MAG: hypothetical protein M0R80_21945 [Proteobacteria bacterium]|jgi:hypothetical protein|nr:hypothetical protein [Pseudomonadota bacterium]